MPPNNVLDGLIRLLAEVSALSPSEIKPEGQLRGYGIDSVRLVDLLIGIEETFGVTVDETQLAGLNTVYDLADHIARGMT